MNDEPAPPAQAAGAAVAAASRARRSGLRGSAPWANRHAKKHADEAKARAEEPVRPGSARSTLREPSGADQIKARIAELHQAVQRIRGLKKRLGECFYEIGQILGQLEEAKLYEAKGYATLESFAERELDLGKATTAKLVRIPRVFQVTAALEYGLDALGSALDALDAEGSKPAARSAHRPLKPPAAR